jgi:hypothetical protein
VRGNTQQAEAPTAEASPAVIEVVSGVIGFMHGC